jgi:Glycogen debranching enzyme
MLTEYGILSVSKNDRTFDFNGYQNGSIWPMLTLLFTAAVFDNDETELGKQLLEILQKKNDSAQCSSRINEIFQPDGMPKGCPSQAWSIGLLPFISERYIAGIEPELQNNRIIIRKRNGITTKKNLYLGDKAIEIDIADGNVKSNYGLAESADRFILEL